MSGSKTEELFRDYKGLKRRVRLLNLLLIIVIIILLILAFVGIASGVGNISRRSIRNDERSYAKKFGIELKYDPQNYTLYIESSQGRAVDVQDLIEAGKGLKWYNSTALAVDAPVCAEGEFLSWSDIGFVCRSGTGEGIKIEDFRLDGADQLLLRTTKNEEWKADLSRYRQRLSLIGETLGISGANSVTFAGWDTNELDDIKLMAELQDVNVSGVGEGDVLQYDGNQWVPSSPLFQDLADTPSGYGAAGFLVRTNGSDALEFVDPLSLDVGYWSRAGTTVSLRNPGDQVVLRMGETLSIRDFVNGGLIFTDGSGTLEQDAANLVWDNVNKRLGIRVPAPDYALHIKDGIIMSVGEIGGSGGSVSGTLAGKSVFYWNPNKGALRAGHVSSDAWDESNVPELSVAFGVDNKVFYHWSSILGGQLNEITSTIGGVAVIAGGQANTIRGGGGFSFIGGGGLNVIEGRYSMVGGGKGNEVYEEFSTIAGGHWNTITADHAIIGGGRENLVDGTMSAILGGIRGEVHGTHSALVGGFYNTIQPGGDYSLLGGGDQNVIGSAAYSVLLGGRYNRLEADYSAVLGGWGNLIRGQMSLTFGRGNSVEGNYSSVIGLSNWGHGNNNYVFGSYMRTANGADNLFVFGFANSGIVPITTTNAFLISPYSPYEGNYLRVGIGLPNPVASLHIQPVDANAIRLEAWGVYTGQTAQLQFMELKRSGNDYVALQGPSSVSSSFSIELPATRGNLNDLLVVDGVSSSRVSLGWINPLALDVGPWIRVGTTIRPRYSGDDLLIPSGGSVTVADFIEGGVVFTDSGGTLIQNTSFFVWDNVNKRLGIGVSVPTSTLNVVGKTTLDLNSVTDAPLVVNQDGSAWIAAFYQAWNPKVIIDNTGNIGVGVTAPVYRLELPNNAGPSGQGRANAWTTYSDSRIKSEQRELEYGLQTVLKLQPKRYVHHDSEFREGQLVISPNGREDIGFIAQEVYQLIPEIVHKPTDETRDLWSLDYAKLAPVLVQAIKDLNAKIESLGSGRDNYWSNQEADLRTDYNVHIGTLYVTRLLGSDVKVNILQADSLDVKGVFMIDKQGMKLAGKAHINGDLTVQKIAAEGINVEVLEVDTIKAGQSASWAGRITVRPGDTEVLAMVDGLSPGDIVVVTPYGPAPHFYVRITEGRFTVVFESAVQSRTELGYIVIQK